MTVISVDMKRKVVWGGRVALAVIAAAGLSAGCGELTRQGEAAVYLQLNQLLGADTGTTDYGSEVHSDVAIYVTSGSTTMITRQADTGQITVRLMNKDPLLSPSSANAVTLTNYRVQFRRTDGRNTPGVDVPYPFDGTVTATVTPGLVLSIPFTLVRAQSKFEAPLAALTGGGSTLVIDAIAHVTFFGHTATGTPVSVEGDITVHFADWPDN